MDEMKENEENQKQKLKEDKDSILFTEAFSLDGEMPPAPKKETKASIGKQLQLTRIREKISLEKMCKDTKIRMKYLQAIEDDNLSIIPEKVAARGFIKICARYLELDHTELLAQLDNKSSEDQSIDKASSLSEKWQKKQPVLSGLFIIAGIIALVLLFIIFNNPEAKSTARVNESSTQIRVTPATNEAKAQEIEEATATLSIKVPKLAKLTAKAIQNAWIKVKVDEKDIFHGMLKKGRSKTWYGKESVQIRSPEPNYINLIFNDKDVGKLGKDHKVSERSFQAERVR